MTQFLRLWCLTPSYASVAGATTQRARRVAMLLTLSASLLGAHVAAGQTDALANDAAATSESQAAAPTDVESNSRPEVPANDPAAVAWLDRITAAMQKVKTLEATIRWDRIQGLLGDEQRRFGTLVYIADSPARFAVHFTRLYVDETWRDQNRHYLFDGVWLVERLDDQKRFTKRQVVPPAALAGDAPPQQLDPLSSGSGPFAIPISPDKQRLLQRFTVRLIEPAEDDPAGSVHLQLTPRPEHDTDFVLADVWYDRETLLPVRARTADESENISIVHLSGMKTNEVIDSKRIDTREPRESGWRLEIVPWEGR